MANGNLGSYAVTLPNIFQAPGQALESATQQLERQTEKMADRAMREQEMAERKAERDEAQMYRKMQTIQELSDLSKYQTANDVANAIGNKSANDIKAKYITLAKEGKVGLADIIEGVNKDIASTTEGMNALKIEGESFENLFKGLKTQFPDLDATALLTDYRKDVTGRRLKDGTSFVNPIEVQQSDLVTNLSNPDYLSKYIRGGKNLTEAITAPKGMEKSSVFVGTPRENTQFEATIPFWKKPSFTAEQAPGGFLQKGIQPSLEIKASTLPPEAIPSSSKVPFKIIDTDVYDRFSQEPKTNLELIQATRDKFPGYDKFNPTEKEYAKRNVLYDKLSTLDQSQFYPTGNKTAPITNINMPKGTPTVDLWSGIKNLVESKKEGFATPFNELPAKTQGILLEFARDASGKGKDELNQTNIVLKKNPQGEIAVYKYDNKKQLLGDMIVPLSEQDVNIEAQATAAGKNQAIKNTGKTEPKSQGQTYSSEIEAKIGNVLKANPGASRQDVINALKKEGKI
jgi:hypothetical protein